MRVVQYGDYCSLKIVIYALNCACISYTDIHDVDDTTILGTHTTGHWPFSMQNCQMTNHFLK